MLSVNCHNCGKEFNIDEHLLEFYFECKIICPSCTATKEPSDPQDLPDIEGLPSFS